MKNKNCTLILSEDYKGTGTQLITMPDGQIIPGQIWSRVYTGIDEHPYAIVKVLIDIKPTTNNQPPQ